MIFQDDFDWLTVTGARLQRGGARLSISLSEISSQVGHRLPKSCSLAGVHVNVPYALVQALLTGWILKLVFLLLFVEITHFVNLNRTDFLIDPTYTSLEPP